MNSFINFVNTISTTNLRILATLGFIFIYLVCSLITKSDPNTGWLAFFGAMAGLDVAQFASKRMTTKNISNTEFPPPPPPPPVFDTSLIPSSPTQNVEMAQTHVSIPETEEGGGSTDVEEISVQFQSQKG